MEILPINTNVLTDEEIDKLVVNTKEPMDNVLLQQKIKRYAEIKELERNLKKEKEELSQEINAELLQRDIDAFETLDGVVVSLNSKITFKYDDEEKIIAHLKEIERDDLFATTTKVLTTPFNNLLKDERTNADLINAVSDWLTKNKTYETVVDLSEDWHRKHDKKKDKALEKQVLLEEIK